MLSHYPKRLSTKHFFGIYEQIQTYRGLLLANLDRWDEAKPFLERATSPANWMNIVTFYLGQCYYSLGDYLGAKSQLLQALDMRLEPIWTARAHYLLGIVSHNLKDEKFAKHQFELCLKFGPPEYLATTRIWEWLEATSLRLGLHDQAEVYKRRRRIDSTIQ